MKPGVDIIFGVAYWDAECSESGFLSRIRFLTITRLRAFAGTERRIARIGTGAFTK